MTKGDNRRFFFKSCKPKTHLFKIQYLLAYPSKLLYIVVIGIVPFCGVHTMNTIYRLAYVARSRYQQETLAEALRWKPPALQVVTLYGAGYFFQCFEGDEAAVTEMAGRLSELADGFELRILTWHQIDRVSLRSHDPQYMLSGMSMTIILQQHGLTLADARLLDESVQVYRVNVAIRVPSPPIFRTT